MHPNVPSLCVRYTHNKHAVPDLKETEISREFAHMLTTVLNHHDKRGGSVDSDFLLALPLNRLKPEEGERLLHLLHRSKALTGGDVKGRRSAMSNKYTAAEKRLALILAEVNAGNDNLKIKREGFQLADFLRRVKRLNAKQYDQTTARLQNPK